MKSALRDKLSQRLGKTDICELCRLASGSDNDNIKQMMFSFIGESNDRVGYNALWVFTHLCDDDKIWFHVKRDELIDLLLKETHSGKRRLLLRVLSDIPMTIAGVRTDFLDYCLEKINSTEPYAVRALSLVHAYEMCKYFPALIDELKAVIAMMDYGELSPGLLSTKRSIEKKLSRL